MYHAYHTTKPCVQFAKQAVMCITHVSQFLRLTTISICHWRWHWYYIITTDFRQLRCFTHLNSSDYIWRSTTKAVSWITFWGYFEVCCSFSDWSIVHAELHLQSTHNSSLTTCSSLSNLSQYCVMSYTYSAGWVESLGVHFSSFHPKVYIAMLSFRHYKYM